MKSLRNSQESLLKACCDQIRPDWDRSFNYSTAGASIGMDAGQTSDIAMQLAEMKFFKTLSYGTTGSLDRDGREYARGLDSVASNQPARRDVSLDSKPTEGRPLKVFISHSSKDKVFVRRLSERLTAAGFLPWLDEAEIKVGESITARIEEGLCGADVVVFVLSKHSVESSWVDREWRTKYWDQVNSRKTLVFPVRLEQCEIPYLLKDIKYADFSSSFDVGLANLISGMTPSSGKPPTQPLPTTPNAEQVTALISKAHARDMSLAAILVDCLTFTQRTGNATLAEFCRDELSGGNCEPEKIDTMVIEKKWRIVECFASVIGKLNRSFVAFQNEESTFRYIEERPTEFVPMFLLWGKSVGDIEDDAAAVVGTTTALEVHRKHGDMVTGSRTPNADVYIYMKKNTSASLLRSIRRELVSRLLVLLPKLQAPVDRPREQESLAE